MPPPLVFNATIPGWDSVLTRPKDRANKGNKIKAENNIHGKTVRII